MGRLPKIERRVFFKWAKRGGGGGLNSSRNCVHIIDVTDGSGIVTSHMVRTLCRAIFANVNFNCFLFKNVNVLYFCGIPETSSNALACQICISVYTQVWSSCHASIYIIYLLVNIFDCFLWCFYLLIKVIIVILGPPILSCSKFF